MNDERKNELVVRHVHEHRHLKPARQQRDLPARRQSNDDDTTAAAVKGGIIGAVIGVFTAIVIGAWLDD